MTDDQIDAAAMEIYDQDMYRHNVDIEYRTPWGNRHDTGRFGKNAYRTMVLRVITALDIPAIEREAYARVRRILLSDNAASYLEERTLDPEYWEHETGDGPGERYSYLNMRELMGDFVREYLGDDEIREIAGDE